MFIFVGGFMNFIYMFASANIIFISQNMALLIEVRANDATKFCSRDESWNIVVMTFELHVYTALKVHTAAHSLSHTHTVHHIQVYF